MYSEKQSKCNLKDRNKKMCPKCGAENPIEANFCRKCRFAFNNQRLKRELLKKSVIVSVVFVIMAVIVASIIVAIRHNISESDQDTIQNYIPETFAGNYACKMESSDMIIRNTATISEYALNECKIEVFTEYGKTIYTFRVMSDGTLNSPELGKGVVFYKERINKLTIVFNGRESKCEFSKVQ